MFRAFGSSDFSKILLTRLWKDIIFILQMRKYKSPKTLPKISGQERNGVSSLMPYS